MTPTDTFKFMERDPNRKVSRTIVFDWYRLFKDDREELENSSKVDRPTLSDRYSCCYTRSCRQQTKDGSKIASS